MAETGKTREAEGAAAKRPRSPNHPMIDLKTAIELMSRFFNEFGKHRVPIGEAQKLWDYTEHGSAGNQCVAALSAYGLIDVSGKNRDRKLSISGACERIVRNAPDKSKLLKKAALSPPIHQEVYDEYSNQHGLPVDSILKTYLQWDRPEGKRFTDDAVVPFMTRLRTTLEYAGIVLGENDNNAVSSNGGTTPHESAVDTLNNGTDPKGAQEDMQVGSFVQWTSQGVDQFDVPRKVLGIQGDYAFVEGSQTGIPLSDLSIVTQPTLEKPLAPPPVNPFYLASRESEVPTVGMALDRTTLDEGAVRLEWPDSLTPESVEEFQDWMIGRINRARRKAGLGKIRVVE